MVPYVDQMLDFAGELKLIPQNQTRPCLVGPGLGRESERIPLAPRRIIRPGHNNQVYSRNKAQTRSPYKGCLSFRGSVWVTRTVLEHPTRRSDSRNRPMPDPPLRRARGRQPSVRRPLSHRALGERRQTETVTGRNTTVSVT
jgi:hypothetical protein